MSDKKNAVIIQPVGAIEQHGLHLLLIVDAELIWKVDTINCRD